MGNTKYKMTINKDGVILTLDARKGINYSTLLYLKAEIYAPEGSLLQEKNRNLLEEKERSRLK